MQNYKEQCKISEERMREKHENEYETEKKKLEDTIPVIPKHSTQYLNLKRIQATLVKNKEYKEAHDIQVQMNELEEKERENWGSGRDSKIKQQLNLLVKRQEQEVNNFKLKAKNGFDELKKQRAAELESLLKRFQNLKKELTNSHKIQNNRFEGKEKSGFFASMDKPMASRMMASPSGFLSSRAERPTSSRVQSRGFQRDSESKRANQSIGDMNEL